MSCFRTHFPALYRFATLLALVAILTPTLTVLVHHPKPEMVPVTITDAAMTNCGMDMGKQSIPQKESNTPKKIPSCPICVGLQLLGGGFVPPDAVIFHMPVMPVMTYAVVWLAFLVAFSVAPQSRPRAPPAPV